MRSDLLLTIKATKISFFVNSHPPTFKSMTQQPTYLFVSTSKSESLVKGRPTAGRNPDCFDFKLSHYREHRGCGSVRCVWKQRRIQVPDVWASDAGNSHPEAEQAGFNAKEPSGVPPLSFSR